MLLRLGVRAGDRPGRGLLWRHNPDDRSGREIVENHLPVMDHIRRTEEVAVGSMSGCRIHSNGNHNFLIRAGDLGVGGSDLIRQPAEMDY